MRKQPSVLRKRSDCVCSEQLTALNLMDIGSLIVSSLETAGKSHRQLCGPPTKVCIGNLKYIFSLLTWHLGLILFPLCSFLLFLFPLQLLLTTTVNIIISHTYEYYLKSFGE